MTPSLMRNVESIRRPMTAASGDYAGGGLGMGLLGLGRGYHPYANAVAYGHTNRSAAGSEQSSPATYPAQLDFTAPSAEGASSQGGEPGEGEGGGGYGGVGVGAPAPVYGAMYRTESPSPYAAQAEGGGGSPGYANQGTYAGPEGVYQHQGYVQEADVGVEGFYGLHPQHVTTM
jgi:hypothetical protein